MRKVIYEFKDDSGTCDAQVLVGEWDESYDAHTTCGERRFVPADGDHPVLIFDDEVASDVEVDA